MTCARLTQLLLTGEPCTLEIASAVYASEPGFLSNLFLLPAGLLARQSPGWLSGWPLRWR